MPRFALLEYHWDGVHWDLLLDVGEALRTWAIDTPIVAGVTLPVRALGDHRRVYLDYEVDTKPGRITWSANAAAMARVLFHHAPSLVLSRRVRTGPWGTERCLVSNYIRS